MRPTLVPAAGRPAGHAALQTSFDVVRVRTKRCAAGLLGAAALCCAAVVVAQPSSNEDSGEILTIDHYVPHASTVPAMAGETAQLYVRERVSAGMLARVPAFEERVVLFVHGAGTPAEVAFDVPFEDYSWMSYLARAGFDVFSVEMTGYGRSTRPLVMNDPCNLSAEQQAALVPGLLAAPCAPAHPHRLTTIESDWNDLGAAVDYVRALRGVERVSLIAWSLGGPRAGGYAARNPEKVEKLVLLAPAYSATSADRAPATLPGPGVPMTTQTYDAFVANWDRQVGCADQYDPAARDAVWAKMLRSDPVGATWGPGVRRAPSVTTWGWNAAAAARTRTPTLVVAGVHDAQVAPERARQLYLDLGAPQKVFVDLGCSSHNAMWETNRLDLFRASLEWLTRGTVDGTKAGELRLGY